VRLWRYGIYLLGGPARSRIGGAFVPFETYAKGAIARSGPPQIQ